MALVGGKLGSGPIQASSDKSLGQTFTKDFLRGSGPGSNGYGSATDNRSGPGSSTATNGITSPGNSSVSNGYAQASDNPGAIMTTTAGRTEAAASQVTQLANSLKDTAFASRFGAEAVDNQYANSASAVATNYGLASPGTAPASSFSSASSALANGASSAWSAVGGSIGSVFGGAGSALGSTIGSYYGGSGGGSSGGGSTYDWFFQQIDNMWKHMHEHHGHDPKDPTKPGTDPESGKPGGSSSQLSPEVQALKDGVSDFVKPYAEIGSKIADAVTSPFKDMYNALTSENKTEEKKAEEVNTNKDAEQNSTKTEEVKNETQKPASDGVDSALSLFKDFTNGALDAAQNLAKQAVGSMTSSNQSQQEMQRQQQDTANQVQEQAQAAQKQAEEATKQEPPPPPPPPPEKEQATA